MGNAHHHAKYPVGAGGLNPTLHQPISFSFSQSKSNSFAFSNHVSPPRPVSALKSCSYLKMNPAGQQMAAHTVTQQLCVNKSKARLSKPTHRRLHALPPELWKDKRAALQSACLSPQTVQTLWREVSLHPVGAQTPVPRSSSPLPTLQTDQLFTKKKFMMNIRWLRHDTALTH